MKARLFSKSLQGEGLLVLIRLRITPESNSILPPFTSRTLKSIAGNANCLKPVWNLYSSRKRFKPVTFRVLTTDRFRPLYKRVNGEDSDVITVRKDYTYYGFITFYARSLADVPVAECDEQVSIEYGRFHVAMDSMDMRMLDFLGRDEYERVKISIRTPLTITTKIMSPPVKTGSRLARLLDSTREAYRLLPTPGFIAAQAARQWLGIVKTLEPKGHILPYAIGRLSDIMIAEIDYHLRPITVLYGKDEAGRKRLVRGVTGFIVLEPVNDSIRFAFSRLLDFASILGLGKSRSIGFGELTVEYK